MNTYRKIAVTAFIILFLALAPAFVLPAENRAAEAETLSYALIGDGAVLYDKVGADYVTVTNLPQNYFVILRGQTDADGYIPVSYLDLVGYVKPEAVEPVDYEPKYKYAETNSLTLYNDGHEINVRTSPEHTLSNVAAVLAENTELYYYGTASGSTQVEQVGNVWYYVRYTEGGTAKRGYVYSLYVRARPIPENVIEKVAPQETQPPQENPDDTTTDPTNTENPEPSRDYELTRPREIIIIVSLCLPVIVIMYLLFKQPPKKRENE